MKRAVIVYNKSTCSSSFPNLTVNYLPGLLAFICVRFLVFVCVINL